MIQRDDWLKLAALWFVASLVGVLFGACLVRMAHAQVVEPKAAEMVAGADMVISGKIKSVDTGRDTADDGSWTEKTTVVVGFPVKHYKPVDAWNAPDVTFTIPGGPIAHFPTFKVGEEYLLFFKGGKLLGAELGAVPVDLDAPPTQRSLAPGETESLDDALRRKFNLAPPAPSPRPTEHVELRFHDDLVERDEWGVQPLANPTANAMAGASPGPWRYFWTPMLGDPDGKIDLVQMNEADEFPGQEATARAIRAAAAEISAKTGLEVTVRDEVGSYSGGYRIWPGEFRVILNDPANELTNPQNCSGILAVGGPGGGGAGSVYMADGWEGCAGLVNERERGETILHELLHAMGLLHSYEVGESGVTPYQQTATISPYLIVGRGAKFMPYDDDAASHIYPGGGSGPSPTATASPVPTRTPVPTVSPSPKPTRNAFACPLTNQVQAKCDCPSGKAWSHPRLCPRPSGKWSVKCKCEAASIGVLPSGCSR